MSMFNTLLSLDTELLIHARGLISPEYAPIVQILGESIVIWCMLVLLGLWFTGVYNKDSYIKTNAIRICLTVIGVFAIYAIINFCTPQWRPSPQTVV